VLLAAFLLTFLFIRTSARLMRSPKVTWWPGSVTTESGLHLHHLVWGIVLLLLTGFLGFVLSPTSPRTEILAVMFGIGAGLTLDEFALWVHLKDVYWAEEGRSSFDAVVVAAVIGGLVVVGAAPFDLPQSGSSVDEIVVAVLIDLLLFTVAVLKGRWLLALVGVFVPLVSLVAALRLASPTSRWAHRRYRAGSRKLARAQARFARIAGRDRRLSDAIAGPPSVPAVAEQARHGPTDD
jgi:di/tricarboxylate transporter